jgi:hypothetical protein
MNFCSQRKRGGIQVAKQPVTQRNAKSKSFRSLFSIPQSLNTFARSVYELNTFM